MQKIRVCHLTSAHPHHDTRIFIKECSSLALAGFEVHFVAPNAPISKCNGVYIHSIKKSTKGRLERMTKTVFDVFRKAREIDADVYHFHDPELILIGLALKMQGKKVIYDVHEDVPRQILSKHWIPSYLRKSISLIIEFVEKKASNQYDGIVTATSKIRDRFKIYNMNTFDIQNYPLLNELKFDDMKKSNDEVDDTNYLVFAGGITKIRGIIEMIKALEIVNKHANVRLLLVGNFNPNNLEEEVKQQPGWKFVEYLGWLDRGSVRNVLAKAKIGLVLFHPEPNHIEAQPNKMFEYMSAGLPLVTSNFPLWKEIVEGNSCGITADPLNEFEIASSIIKLLNDRERALELGKNGRKAVEEKYNWEKEQNKLISIYRQMFDQFIS